MTGRDLIIYILENNLENEPVFKDGRLLGFITPMESAVKFDVGLSTIKVWADQGLLPGIKIDSGFYILANAERSIVNERGK